MHHAQSQSTWDSGRAHLLLMWPLKGEERKHQSTVQSKVANVQSGKGRGRERMGSGGKAFRKGELLKARASVSCLPAPALLGTEHM